MTKPCRLMDMEQHSSLCKLCLTLAGCNIISQCQTPIDNIFNLIKEYIYITTRILVTVILDAFASLWITYYNCSFILCLFIYMLFTSKTLCLRVRVSKLCGGMNYKSKYGILFFTPSVPVVFLGVVPMASNQISLYKVSDIYFNKAHRF